MIRYKVMVRHEFPSQDGYDYMNDEASGLLHTTREYADKEIEGYYEDPILAGESFWIEEVEV